MSENVAVGHLAPIGTNAFHIIMDLNKIGDANPVADENEIAEMEDDDPKEMDSEIKHILDKIAPGTPYNEPTFDEMMGRDTPKTGLKTPK